MKKVINQEWIEGRIFQHDLVVKTVQNQSSKNFGKEFISGNLEVAVDEEGMNVIPVHFTYVTETTNSGGRNNTFIALKRVIDEGKVWITDGKDNAMKVQISNTALALNDFYPANSDDLVSLKVNEGGFVTIVNKICDEGIDRHKFKVDMLITSVRRVDPEDPEENSYVILKGATFNFRNDILPMDFVVRNPEGMNYFENLNATPKTPVYVNLWGRINSVTKKEKKEDVSAFGESAISYVEKKVKEWVVTGVSPEAYTYGDENILTDMDVTTAMQNREVMLAEKKKQSEEWRASRVAANASSFNGGAMNAPSTPTNQGGFNF